MLPAHHSLQFRVHTRVLLTLLVALAATAMLWAEPPHRVLLREADSATKAGDLPLAIEKLEATCALRPDYPRGRFLLANAYLTAGRGSDALAQLRNLGERGITSGALKSPAVVAALGNLEGFADVAARFQQNAQPIGNAVTRHTLPAQEGIVESIAIDQQGRYYFGDVRQRCIWMLDENGALKRFSQVQDGMLGIFGLAIDEARGVLWAGVSAVPEMAGYTATDSGGGYVAEYDLATGSYRRSLQLPTAGGWHVLGSLRLARDGSVFVSDSASPVIWRAAPGATQLEAWLEHDHFASLQGLDFSADGRTLYVADYANGIWRIDVATKQPTLLKPAGDTTLFGIDDLHVVDDALLGVQNGIAPSRIVRIALRGDEPHHAEVLLQGHAAMTDAATGVLRNGRFEFLANSGWALFEGNKSAPAPRDVTVLALDL